MDRMPPLLRIVLSVVMSFTIVILYIRLAGQYDAVSSNPFAPFEDVLPGQAVRSIEAQGFSCRRGSYVNNITKSCTATPVTGIFSRVGIAVSQDTIVQTTFIMRGNALKVGSLMLLMGTPEIHQYGHATHFVWLDRGVTAVTDTLARQAVFFLPLWSVSFTVTGLPIVMRLRELNLLT